MCVCYDSAVQVGGDSLTVVDLSWICLIFACVHIYTEIIPVDLFDWDPHQIIYDHSLTKFDALW